MKKEEEKARQLTSILVVTLSNGLLQLLNNGFKSLKTNYISKQIRKIQKIQKISQNHISRSRKQSDSYRSINDFKPIVNNYSSVKIYEDDVDQLNFQTKKEEILSVWVKEQEKVQMCQLQRWMLYEKCKEIFPQKYPQVEYASKSILTYSDDALQSIKTCQFDVFKMTMLKKKKTWFFNESEPLKYKTCPIKDSLLDLSDHKVEIALDLFELLLVAGGDANSPKYWIEALWQFICKVMQQKQDIKEEAFFQVIKQCSTNKVNYLRILCCVCAIVKPPDRMYLPLLNYLYHKNLENPSGSLYYNFSFFILIKNFNQPHQTPPSMFDLFCISELKKIPLIISFPKQKVFFMEPYSRVEQIIEELIKLYGLDNSVAYLINIQGILMENGDILDQINQYYFQLDEESENSEKSWNKFYYFSGYRGYLVLKNMADYNSTIGSFLIMFNHLIWQFRKGMFSLCNQDCLKIGGLLIVSEMFDEECFQFCLSRYIPINRRNGSHRNLKEHKNQILNHFSKFTGSKIEARLEIMKMLAKSKLFLSHFSFVVVYFDDNNETEFEAYLAIKPDSFIIASPTTLRIQMQIRYEEIKEWGYSKTEICLKVKKIGTVHLETKSINLIRSIFSEYLQYIHKKVKSENDS